MVTDTLGPKIVQGAHEMTDMIAKQTDHWQQLHTLLQVYALQLPPRPISLASSLSTHKHTHTQSHAHTHNVRTSERESGREKERESKGSNMTRVIC